MSNSLELRQFHIREADWKADGKQLSNIRRLVFIVEQAVPQDEEWDGKDETSWHWIATDNNDNPIGTARLLPDGQIGRMAVLESHRQYGVGAALLEQAVEKARHLGFQQVFLNAQTHALGFYERGGFVAEGDEFLEAGIAHRRMVQKLSPPVDNIQRRQAATPEFDISMKPFDTGEVEWEDAGNSIRRIRRLVYDAELAVVGYRDLKETDDDAIHWAAKNDDNHPIGVISMTPQGTIYDLAVLDDYRGNGIGSSLLELAFQRARRFGLPAINITENANPSFLRKRHFQQTEQQWQRIIEEEDREVTLRQNAGEAVSDDATYHLGVDKQLILLRRDSDFRNIILEMTRQARRSIQILSPNLSHDLLDSSELGEICSALARRNRYTHIEILVFDPHRVVKHGHTLLSIARKLPSSIRMKVVDPEMRKQNHEYILVDGQGFIYRQDYESYEGTACFSDITECNRLNRQFTACWETGILDPNLRQLRI